MANFRDESICVLQPKQGPGAQAGGASPPLRLSRLLTRECRSVSSIYLIRSRFYRQRRKFSATGLTGDNSWQAVSPGNIIPSARPMSRVAALRDSAARVVHARETPFLSERKNVTPRLRSQDDRAGSLGPCRNPTESSVSR